MAEDLHILHLNSEASRGTYRDNTVENFRCRLPERLILEPAGEWYACLRQCSFGFNFTQSPLYLCCDICHESTAGERKLPVLRVVHQRVGVVYNTCLYVPIRARDFAEIGIQLLKTTDHKFPGYSSSKPTHLTLELRKGLPH